MNRPYLGTVHVPAVLRGHCAEGFVLRVRNGSWLFPHPDMLPTLDIVPVAQYYLVVGSGSIDRMVFIHVAEA